MEIGQRIGRGIIIETGLRTAPTEAIPYGRSAARLRCDCGNEYVAWTLSLAERNGHINTRSCGCIATENKSRIGRMYGGKTSVLKPGPDNPAFRHGLSGHPLYSTWKGMLHRCENPKNRQWKDWGGRGIRVCERWHDPAAFVEDIERDLGSRPDGMTLDRIDNDGDYEPGNVRWMARADQNRNKRSPTALHAENERLRRRVAELEAELASRTGGRNGP